MSMIPDAAKRNGTLKYVYAMGGTVLAIVVLSGVDIASSVVDPNDAALRTALLGGVTALIGISTGIGALLVASLHGT